NDKLIDFTVADSNEVALKQHFFPELRVAFDIGKPQSLAWAFNHRFDYSLHNAAYDFFEQIRENGELENLIERHYGYTEHLNHPRWRLFMSHVNDRLGNYQAMFEEAGQQTDIDWRLLAAMGYQESLWNPDARSPTGVRGMMMLTRNTAQEMGIDKRTDAQESVDGGSRYMRQMLQVLPAEIEEPDRTWFALAAYNVGLGHVEDARRLTRQLGQNPNLWTHVKESLPLLREKKWYMQVPYGYARGDEAVQYVQNIRAYYELLVWMNERNILVGQTDADTRPAAAVTTADATDSVEVHPLPAL
ncbi:MAG: membrane-bound lytic murein transglycosylase MltF, partial [Nitrospira sp.]|nr:membrane-bound lytic murein transglycosylase MltF [Nitrospira sp.]